MSKDRLAEYRSKRDTSASGEPAGRRGKKRGGDLFVVQRQNLTGVSKDKPVGMAAAVEDGHLPVWLDGRQEKWLLVKKDDEGADRRAKPARTKPESVLSGRVNEDFE